MIRTGSIGLSAVLPYFSGRAHRVALCAGLILLQTVTVVPVAALIQGMFDRWLPQADMRGLLLALAAVLALFTVNALAVVGNRHVTLDLVKSGVRRLRSDVMRQLLRRERSFYAEEDLDNIHTAVVQDTERVDMMASALLTQLIPGVLVGAGLSAFMVWVNPLLFCVVGIAMLATVAYGRRSRARLKLRVKRFHADFSAFSKGASFLLKFSELISFSAAETHEFGRQDKHIEALRASSQRMAWAHTAHSVLQNYFLTIGGILVLLIGGIQVLHHTSTNGALLSFYIALNLLTSQARSIISALPTIMEGMQSAAMLEPLLRPLPPARTGAVFKELHGEIALENIGVSHGETFALSGVDMVLRKGEIVALYGASGSGKTTLLNVLLGLHQPTQGRVRVDGLDLNSIDQTSWRSRIGVLSQNALLFPATIRENLLYGLSHTDDEQMMQACRTAGIHDFIMGLLGGYDSSVGERGARLSGGQGQRIAMARALLRQPQILILDEPDNHLDERATADILARVRAAGLTTMVVSHDRNLFPQFDRIYELSNGHLKMLALPTAPPTPDDAPLVSVVLPAFNAERYVADAIRSVLAQTYAPIEIICVNDGSTDGTAAVLAGFGDRIVVIDCAENAGIGAARNQALGVARGSFIAFMDADDLCSPGKLELQMQRLRSEPALAISFTHMQCFISPELPDEVKALRDCPTEPTAGLLASTAVVRKEVFDRIGGFDPALRVGEFIDWLARAREAGYEYRMEDAVAMQRRIHDSNTGVTQRRSYADYVKVARQALERKRKSAQDAS